MLCSMLSGVSKLAKLLQESSVTSSVTASILSSRSSKVLSDSNFPSAEAAALQPLSETSSDQIKDEKWLADAQKQICQHLFSFQSLTNHSSSKIRLSLLDLVRELSGKRQVTLEPGRNSLLTMLYALSVDEYDSCSDAKHRPGHHTCPGGAGHVSPRG